MTITEPPYLLEEVERLRPLIEEDGHDGIDIDRLTEVRTVNDQIDSRALARRAEVAGEI